MFHVSDNLFFCRLNEQGDVRILKFKNPQNTWPEPGQIIDKDRLEFEFVITGSVWASIVASVSKRGETSDRFYAVQAFHQDPNPSPLR